MKRFAKLILLMSVCLAVLAVVGGLFLLSDIPGLHDGPGLTLSIDGTDIVTRSESHHWLGAIIAGAVLTVVLSLVFFIVVPLVLVLGVGLPLLLLGLALGVVVISVVGAGALLFSPFIVIGLLIWLIVRRKSSSPAAPANIQA